MCAQEIVQQANERGLSIDRVVHATGSTGTQAGLVTGFEGQNSGIRVLGISVRAAQQAQEENVYRLARQTWELLGIRGELPRAAVAANGDYVGAGYGRPTPGMVEAGDAGGTVRGDPARSGFIPARASPDSST